MRGRAVCPDARAGGHTWPCRDDSELILADLFGPCEGLIGALVPFKKGFKGFKGVMVLEVV